ncbi:integrase [Pseudomonas vranovensis]|uniref:integrase n=1 Tax=Pseudomonas vranovensis TaxID=321661 RepID=UPI001FD79AB1|nr:integrase [Pseudomonas vranovensis]
MNPHKQYNICVQGLEKMLNWSFANDVCLLDWTRADFERYSEFIRSPLSAWATSSKQTRFWGDAATDFKYWPINPNWKPFQDTRTCKFFEEIDKNVWKREIRCVKQFMDFYLNDVSSKRENVASAKLDCLMFKPSKARGTISDEVLEWVLLMLPSLTLSTHQSNMIAMFLMIARYSARPLWQVLGSASSPGRVDQFRRDVHGTWLENHPRDGSSVPLPATFGRVLERYLIHLNIDAKKPLPAVILFPKEDSVGCYTLKSFRRIINSIRENLAVLAKTSGKPAILHASQELRRLTAALVANRSMDDC